CWAHAGPARIMAAAAAAAARRKRILAMRDLLAGERRLRPTPWTLARMVPPAGSAAIGATLKVEPARRAKGCAPGAFWRRAGLRLYTIAPFTGPSERTIHVGHAGDARHGP